MLEGINILNQTEIMESPLWFSVVIIVLFIVSLISLIVGIIDAIKDFSNGHTWIFIIITTIAYIAILIMGNAGSNVLTEPTGRYEYQVTIDDSVSMNEFLEEYEIIKVDGKIYTIRDKETE